MTVQTSLNEIQTAIHTKLTGDTTLMGMISGVFDFGAVPANQAYPFVAIGDSIETPDNRFGRRGYDTIQTLDIWDSSNNFQVCQLILARLNTLLDQQPLSLATHHHVYTLYNTCQTLNDPGVNDIRHLVVKYDIFTQE